MAGGGGWGSGFAVAVRAASEDVLLPAAHGAGTRSGFVFSSDGGGVDAGVDEGLGGHISRLVVSSLATEYLTYQQREEYIQ
jgi:hypothetical protein